MSESDKISTNQVNTDIEFEVSTEFDDFLCIQVTKFNSSTSYIDVAKFINGKTLLEYMTRFTVFKLHQRRFKKVKSTFVSFKIKAIYQETFDIIMSPKL